MIADVAIALAGSLLGSLVSSFANGRKIGERLAALEVKVNILLRGNRV